MAVDCIRIATRKSPLALWQAEHVARLLQEAHPGLDVELVRMSTQGDKILDSPLAKVGGKGLFVKELEQSILAGRCDIAVHSMKDVPAELPAGLHLPVVIEREEPRDAFVSERWERFEDLPRGARIGTSSLRRQCQLKALRPDVRIVDLRGNVGTRLRKLDEGLFDAVILASAGLIRLGLGERITERLSPRLCLPAVGQGVIGIECRDDDSEVNALVGALDHSPTRTRVGAERAMNARLEGGCQVPIAGHATLDGDMLTLRGLVGRPDGTEVLRGEQQGAIREAEAVGRGLADELLARGADRILQSIYAR